jgi:mannose-1-phosphate guanylyltransferase
LKDNYSIILAGGVGTRLWPLSTEAFPKQFVDPFGQGKSFLQMTYDRLSAICPDENKLFLTNKRYKKLILNEVSGVSMRQIVSEPCMRNTAPALALAAYKMWKRNKSAKLLVCPSDHLILKEEVFSDAVRRAFEYVGEKEAIITFGIQPTCPHTGYGYIKAADQGSVSDVLRFTEKPDLEKAKSFLAEGSYYWNSGIFVWAAEHFVKLVRKHIPSVAEILDEHFDVLNTQEEEAFLEEYYPKFEDISVDYAILEKANEVKVIPVDMDWDDLGSFGALFERAPKTANSNFVRPDLIVERNSSGNMVLSNGKKVILNGVDNLVVVETDDYLMISSQEGISDIKELRKEALK